jgi:hypothetical protein
MNGFVTGGKSASGMLSLFDHGALGTGNSHKEE